MVPGKALGLIETVGLVGSIEACDAAAKAADVVVSAVEVTDGALVTIKIFGELGAVQAAVEAGSAAASKVGQLLAAHIIANPDDNLDAIMGGAFRAENTPVVPKRNQLKHSPQRPVKGAVKGTGGSIEPHDWGRLEQMRVTELRAYARGVPNLSIKGREISRADKETLLREIRKARAS